MNTEQLADDIHREAESEDKRIGKKKIEKLERRKNNAEDKWLDGEWNKERYHEALERVEKRIASRQEALGQVGKNERYPKVVSSRYRQTDEV